VHFPETDTLGPQPDPIANLTIIVSGGKRSVNDPNANPESAPDGEKPKGEGEKAEGEKKDGEAPPPPPPHEEKVRERDDRKIWAIPARDSYEMSGDNFMPYGAVPHGGIGKCRYNYVGPPEDPDTGRLECHDVDGFTSVFLPLTCLRDLRQK
jgi:hypothetical protein